ncbi:MAG: nicotinate-nucleotide--dimethylbenzimidazole phosphoribosyltransferase [Nitrospirales bacterium]|nr:MAG: nicotinate-nucleotide--dimethylbenzimidazole phosphoribosyltransferase [Nitrospirales bacterium]
MMVEKTMKTILPLDPRLIVQAQAKLDRLTKPRGSLGRLEELAAQYVAISGEESPLCPKARVLTLAADHGVVVEGVSAYPSSVTAQMVTNFLNGGAAINVLARQVGAEVQVVDMGVASHLNHLVGLIDRKIGHGTKNMVLGPAMSRDEAIRSVEIGIELVERAFDDGVRVVATGEMGIGNTTASAAITAVMTGQPIFRITGRGTGVDDEGLSRKRRVIEQALRVNDPQAGDAFDVLCKVGGFEIGGLVGVILGGAACRIPVVLDGFIAGAAALLAVTLAPTCREYLIASHQSAEDGHQVVLEHLGLHPLLDLQLRLGEGTGACLAIGLLQSSLLLMTQMATFDGAGVDQSVTSDPDDPEAT